MHIRQELLFLLQCDRNCCRPAVEEELGWRVARPLRVHSCRLHSLVESQLWIPLPAAAKPPLQAPSVLQSEVQTWTFWVCVALGLFTGPGWGLCYCLSATLFLWEVPLCFNGVFRRWKQRIELWVASASASVTSSSGGLLGWRIPSRYNTNYLYLTVFISSAEMRS